MPAFYTVKKGDTAPVLADVLEDKNGAAVNLTGASVKIHIYDRLGNAIVASGTVTGPGGGALDATGQVQYQWQTADTATPGTYFAEWMATFASGQIERWPDGDQAIVFVVPSLA